MKPCFELENAQRAKQNTHADKKDDNTDKYLLLFCFGSQRRRRKKGNQPADMIEKKRNQGGHKLHKISINKPTSSFFTKKLKAKRR